MRPQVKFCGLDVTRLVIGANPFGGYSHQGRERDEEMKAYNTVGRIKETWAIAEKAGINTMITNNETPHVLTAVKEYLGGGGALQWIAQVKGTESAPMTDAIDQAVDTGCRAIYFHGALTDRAYQNKDAAALGAWADHVRSHGVPVGVAGHAPEAHRWVDSLGIVDFHAVCFFNCGSLHDGKGELFKLADIVPAAACTRAIAKPCIAYKIMGAGRIEAKMAFEYAFDNIKATDIVNVGMYLGDREDMVEENVRIVCKVLGC